eukprot:354439-Chlamydomonas_euryale.AAC.3
MGRIVYRRVGQSMGWTVHGLDSPSVGESIGWRVHGLDAPSVGESMGWTFHRWVAQCRADAQCEPHGTTCRMLSANRTARHAGCEPR